MAVFSREFSVRVQGDLACFTRPEHKTERVSYELMTPSAASGLLASIFWKPAIYWHVTAIEVLQPIRWVSRLTNELSCTGSPNVDHIFVDDMKNRSQRHSLMLRDVEYVIHARFELTERADFGEDYQKFDDQFSRRLANGQCFRQPCLGLAELTADVWAAEPAEDRPRPIDPAADRPLGEMFWGFTPRPHMRKDGRAALPLGVRDFKLPEESEPLFFSARLKGGVLHVPPLEMVLLENGYKRTGGLR